MTGLRPQPVQGRLRKRMTLEHDIRIVAVDSHPRGTMYEVAVDDRSARLLLAGHALRRAIRWGLSDRTVLRALLLPDEGRRGHRDRFIAQQQTDGHIVRVIYEYEQSLPVVITVYSPLAKRHFTGGGTYEDRILT
jgi:hypothetical protein